MLPLDDCIAVLADTLNDNPLGDLVKRPDNDRPACQNEVLLGNEFSTSLHVRTYDGQGRDITEAEIFLESHRNDGI